MTSRSEGFHHCTVCGRIREWMFNLSSIAAERHSELRVSSVIHSQVRFAALAPLVRPAKCGISSPIRSQFCLLAPRRKSKISAIPANRWKSVSSFHRQRTELVSVERSNGRKVCSVLPRANSFRTSGRTVWRKSCQVLPANRCTSRTTESRI